MNIFNKTSLTTILSIAMLAMVSCTTEPRAIKPGTDRCEHCKMTVTDSKFGGELITSKGKIYVFDDLSCMVIYHKQRKEKASANDRYFVVDYLGEMPFIPAEQAYFLKSETVFRTPMGSSTAAFGSLKKLEDYMRDKTPGELLEWSELIK